MGLESEKRKSYRAEGLGRKSECWDSRGVRERASNLVSGRQKRQWEKYNAGASAYLCYSPVCLIQQTLLLLTASFACARVARL